MKGTIRQKLYGLSITIKRIRQKLFIDYGGNYRDSIILAGTGRSGTTWLSDIINYSNEYRYMFEPFYPSKVSICSNFKYKQYLRPENHDPSYILPAQSILTGKIRNDWVDAHNKKKISQKRLIKDIRANFILRWLYENFPGVKIILAMRHPCAVVNSRIKLNWNTHFEEFLDDDFLIEDFLAPYIDAIKNADNDFDKQIFLWCIENYVPLKQFSEGDIHLAFYENFCKNPENECRRLFAFLHKQVDDAVLKSLDKPSVTVRQESAIVRRENLVDSWRKNITKEQMRRALDILAMFGLDEIYTEDSLPNVAKAYAFMSKERTCCFN